MTDTTEEEDPSFIAYWDALDAALQRLWGIDTNTGGISADEVAAAQESGETPEEYAQWHGEKYDLTPRGGWGDWR